MALGDKLNNISKTKKYNFLMDFHKNWFADFFPTLTILCVIPVMHGVEVVLIMMLLWLLLLLLRSSMGTMLFIKYNKSCYGSQGAK